MEPETYIFPLREKNYNFLFDAIGLANPDPGKVYTHLTGCLLVTSNRVMQYVLKLYAYDTNAILVKPIKKRRDADMLRAYDVLYDKLKNWTGTKIEHYGQ